MQLPKNLAKEVSPDTQITRSPRRALPSGDHGTVAPPVPIPNTEVKRCCADDSMAIGHAKVGRRQFITPRISNQMRGVFFVPSGSPLHTLPPSTSCLATAQLGPRGGSSQGAGKQQTTQYAAGHRGQKRHRLNPLKTHRIVHRGAVEVWYEKRT